MSIPLRYGTTKNNKNIRTRNKVIVSIPLRYGTTVGLMLFGILMIILAIGVNSS